MISLFVVFLQHQLLYFTDLRCCCVCPTPIALFHCFIFDRFVVFVQDVVVFVPQLLLYFTDLRCCCVCTQVLFDFTGLRCCCVCPTPIALFHSFKISQALTGLCCVYTTIVWFHRLKMLLCFSHTNCFISQV